MERQALFLSLAALGAGVWVLLGLSACLGRWGRRRGTRRHEGPLALGGGVGLVASASAWSGALGLILGNALPLSAQVLAAATGAALIALGIRDALRAYFRPVADLVPVAAQSVRAGAEGHVWIPIPEGGVGAVVLSLAGRRITRPARGAAQEALPRLAPIHVVAVHGGTVLVSASLGASSEPLDLGPPRRKAS